VLEIKGLRKGRKERAKGGGNYSWYDEGQVIPSSMLECRCKTEGCCLVVFSKSLGLVCRAGIHPSFRCSARTISKIQGHGKVPSE
jgi:hypothetical protein